MLKKFKNRIKELTRQLVYEGVERFFKKNLSNAPGSLDVAIKKHLYFQSLFIYLSNRLEQPEEILLLFNVLSLRIYQTPLPGMEDFTAFADRVETYRHVGSAPQPESHIRWTSFFDFMDFEELKIPLRTHTYTSSAKIFYSGQYKHPSVHIEAGDIVLDAGVLFGDTSLWFAYQTGNKGHVHSFEFVPEFIARMKDNFSLNPEYSHNISIHQYALWDETGKNLNFQEDGGRSHVGSSSLPDESDAVYANTITIDDFIEQQSIQMINFIKMDIEGSEVRALKGAEKTIKRFKPKLAICLYHKDYDFVEIPKLIDSFGLGYKFYLGHHTDNPSETVLYAN